MELNKIHTGKMEEVLKDFPDNYADSIVTDPPYGLKFMGKKWDYSVPSVYQWEQALRVLKPGGHILCACGTRTQHRMAVNIEDAGFEIRDLVSWIYGSGFPKSLDISKAIDKMNGAERERFNNPNAIGFKYEGKDRGQYGSEAISSEAISSEAIEWDGWGTALKPAIELWTLARKPISENTIAANVLKHGTGAINIDGCRVEFQNEQDKDSATWGRGTDILGGNYVGATHSSGKENIEANNKGRFPSNVILDEFTAAELDKQTGVLNSGGGNKGNKIENVGIFGNGKIYDSFNYDANEGGGSRFFYVAKPSQYERNKGLKGHQAKFMDEGRDEGSLGGTNPRNRGAETKRENFHPTVKPIELMRYLVRLITPKGGMVLDPFCGSGSTLIACKLEMKNYIGIDLNEEYCKISEARIAAWNAEKYLSQTLF